LILDPLNQRSCCPFHQIPQASHDLCERELEIKILEQIEKVIADFNLIQNQDRVLVAVSGGKDSYLLLHALGILQKRGEISFSLVAINIDHGFVGYQAKTIEEYVVRNGFDFHLHRTDIAGLLEEKFKPGKNRCSLCSRLRRGALYQLAPKLGCNKIALGHHADDLIETLLLNLFYTGQLKSMPPWLQSDDGRNTVIRPLAYVSEADIASYAYEKGFPIACCCCPACGVNDNQQRRNIKTRLGEMEKNHPGIKSNLLTALKNVVPSHLQDRRFIQD